MAGFIEFAFVLQLQQYNEKHRMSQKQSIGVGYRLGSTRSVKHHSCKRGYRVSDQYKTGAPIMMIRKEFNVRKIDVIAFGVVSVLFFIFNVSYWITFLGANVTLM